MKTYILNFKDKETPASMHDYLALMLELPKFYGRNLDALYDCLTSITTPTSITIVNIDPDNAMHRRTLGVFKDAAADNERLRLQPGQDRWV